MTKEKITNSVSSLMGLTLITQGDQILIDGRLLHKSLNARSRYREWISYRIKEYNFEEGTDYFAEKFRKTSIVGGRPRKEYYLTLDMAKELAMLERNEIGRQIRRYFIAAERKLRAMPALPSLPEVFKGIPIRKVNDREMLPYQRVLEVCGYSTRSSSATRRANYWMHFIKEGSKLLITREFAEHLYWQKHVMRNRQVLKAQQAVLPLNFGDSSMLLKGGAPC